ncbi:MAG TPA: Gmad2 immunoglobulin-like domain-containing protein [Candidatus Moranbacteria bacterium]|nr:Gmad2 immunoglobulin-like domain-containing protein [Candidatus Moranbacteria bacterium]HRZ33843.1 Gmad2 immunoglobulin-like domain-containing protein [Candidatus Moranbacteria bacterium]
MKKTSLIIIGAVALLFLIILAVRFFSGPEDGWVCNENKWVKHGNPSAPMPKEPCGKISSSQPEQKQPETLRVYFPKSNDKITSPVIVSGQASGWYFEGTFPVKIVDEKGKELGKGNVVSLDGNWMTTEFVPFKGSINFSAEGAKSGKIIFEKDNPSGLPQNAESYSLPVNF